MARALNDTDAAPSRGAWRGAPPPLTVLGAGWAGDAARLAAALGAGGGAPVMVRRAGAIACFAVPGAGPRDRRAALGQALAQARAAASFLAAEPCAAPCPPGAWPGFVSRSAPILEAALLDGAAGFQVASPSAEAVCRAWRLFALRREADAAELALRWRCLRFALGSAGMAANDDLDDAARASALLLSLAAALGRARFSREDLLQLAGAPLALALPSFIPEGAVARPLRRAFA